MTRVHHFARRGFGARPDAYERARPGYSAAAIEWILETAQLGAGASVVDVGAGTGKCTRALLAFDLDVVAVEPVAEMRATMVATCPGVRAIDGTAESIPLPDETADLITAAQAFHWFEEAAMDELARVLKPGGRVAVLWNLRDAGSPLQRELRALHLRHRPAGATDERWREIMRRRPGMSSDTATPELLARSDRFEGIVARRFPHEQRLTRSGLVERTATISFVAAADDATRAAILDEARQIASRFPEPLSLPYTTTVFMAKKRALRSLS